MSTVVRRKGGAATSGATVSDAAASTATDSDAPLKSVPIDSDPAEVHSDELPAADTAHRDAELAKPTSNLHTAQGYELANIDLDSGIPLSLGVNGLV